MEHNVNFDWKKKRAIRDFLMIRVAEEFTLQCRGCAFNLWLGN